MKDRPRCTSQKRNYRSDTANDQALSQRKVEASLSSMPKKLPQHTEVPGLKDSGLPLFTRQALPETGYTYVKSLLKIIGAISHWHCTKETRFTTQTRRQSAIPQILHPIASEFHGTHTPCAHPGKVKTSSLRLVFSTA